MNEEEFIKYSLELGIKLTSEQLLKFKKYLKKLKEWNSKFNLTSIIEDELIYLKHFYDSMCIVKTKLIEKVSLCDFGTGAGFPGLVIAIICPKTNVTLVESNGKKSMFLKEIVKELELNNVVIINERIEIYARNNFEKFDIVTCRAVSNINIILELSSQLVKIGGYFIPLKSNKDEITNAFNNKSLGYKLEDIIEYKLPIEESSRVIPVYKKIEKTDNKYPRNYNIILKDFKN